MTRYVHFVLTNAVVFGLCVFLFAGDACAQFENGASPNPLGSGARATGMGGAFIAVADDATAASWNPAGLVQLERPEISAVGSYSSRRETIRSSTHPETNGANDTSACDLNYLSAVYPFTLFDRNVVVSLNFQRLYDMNKDYSGRWYQVSGPFVTDAGDRFRQRGGLCTVSPALAVQLTPQLSVGFTFNFWENPFGRNGWVAENWRDSVVTFSGNPFPAGTGTYYNRDDIDFSGTNFHAGVLFSPTARLTIGGVYKSGFISNIRMTRDTISKTSTTQVVHYIDYLKMTMPQSYGLGGAYRFTDELTVALDVYRTEWGEFILNHDGYQTRPNIRMDQSSSKMDATTQVRLGGEYLFIGSSYVVPVRAGVFYDPEPSENNPNTFVGVSLGSGLAYGPVAFDFSYTFRTGKTEESLGPGGVDSYIDQNSVMFSAIYHM